MEEEISLYEIYCVIKKRKHILFLTIIIFILFSFFYILTQKNLYKCSIIISPCPLYVEGNKEIFLIENERLCEILNDNYLFLNNNNNYENTEFQNKTPIFKEIIKNRKSLNLIEASIICKDEEKGKEFLKDYIYFYRNFLLEFDLNLKEKLTLMKDNLNLELIKIEDDYEKKIKSIGANIKSSNLDLEEKKNQEESLKEYLLIIKDKNAKVKNLSNKHILSAEKFKIKNLTEIEELTRKINIEKNNLQEKEKKEAYLKKYLDFSRGDEIKLDEKRNSDFVDDEVIKLKNLKFINHLKIIKAEENIKFKNLEVNKTTEQLNLLKNYLESESLEKNKNLEQKANTQELSKQIKTLLKLKEEIKPLNSFLEKFYKKNENFDNVKNWKSIENISEILIAKLQEIYKIENGIHEIIRNFEKKLSFLKQEIHENEINKKEGLFHLEILNLTIEKILYFLPKEIEKLKEDISELENLKNNKNKELEFLYADLEFQIEKINQELNKLEKDLNLLKYEENYLKNDFKINKENLNKNIANLSKYNIFEKFIEKSTLDKGKKIIILAIAFILSILFGIFLIFLIEGFFKSKENYVKNQK